jgi:hypothetical protein
LALLGSSFVARLKYWIDYAHFKLVLKWFEVSMLVFRFIGPWVKYLKGEVPQAVPAIVDNAMKSV